MTRAEQRALAESRAKLLRSERRRAAVAADYAEAVRSYQRKRTPASRARAYQEVERQYARALEATERRELAGRAYDERVRRVFQAEQTRKAKRRARAKPERVDPAGTEYELTATTKGGTPRGPGGTADPRRLHLKIRVILDRPMSADTARALLDRALRRGEDVTGITIEGMDWAKGKQAGSAEGTGEDLRRFYGAIVKSPTRFARVRD